MMFLKILKMTLILWLARGQHVVPYLTERGQCKTEARLLLMCPFSFSRPEALICSLQFISSHDAAADLIACTFCCHLKGISCHTPN